MPEKFIILRTARVAAQRRPSLRGRTAAEAQPSTSPGFKVDVEETSKSKALKHLEKKEVVSVVPVMPMKLIEPFRAKKTKEVKTEITWGVEAVRAHESPYDGSGITVAVLDTGIRSDHPAFQGVKITQKDFTGEGEADEHGHGTHCAGTIFGRSVKGVRIGVAPGVKNALIGKVLGESGGGSDMIASAINWAVENGAHVISMSLGIDFPGYVKALIDEGYGVEVATSKALEGYRANVKLFEAIAAFVKSLGSGMFRPPCLLVAAAGNESMRDQDVEYQISVSPPAVSDGFISVGALGLIGDKWEIAGFSNTGPMICGPGVDIVSAGLQTDFDTMSGTSMATPHVAGVVALWAEKLMKEQKLSTPQLVAKLLASGTTDKMKADYDAFAVGAGMVQAPLQ